MKLLFILIPLLIGLILYRNSNLLDPWISNYLPDALWAFSFSSSLFLFLDEKKLKINLLLVGGIGTTIELFQYSNLISGTFDIVDIVVYFLSALSAYIIIRSFER